MEKDITMTTSQRWLSLLGVSILLLVWTRPHHCGHMWELAVPHLPSHM